MGFIAHLNVVCHLEQKAEKHCMDKCASPTVYTAKLVTISMITDTVISTPPESRIWDRRG